MMGRPKAGINMDASAARRKKLYDEMQAIKQLLLEKQIPDDYPDDISIIVQQPFTGDFFIDRFDFINISSFALVSNRWAAPLADYIGGLKCLEIMAGRGVLSKALCDNGVNITATDDFTWKWNRTVENKKGELLNRDELWYGVEDLECVKSIEKYGGDVGFIICCCPPYRDLCTYNALMKMREVNPDCKFIYIGEGRGGCHAEAKFFKEARYITDDAAFNKIAQLYQDWAGMNDGIMLME